MRIAVIGGVSNVVPNDKCFILNNGSMRAWETWDTSVIDMRHGSIMPFQGGYLAMGQVPGYASFESKISFL